MASLYDRFVLPHLLKCACSAPPMMKQRAKIVPKAEGRVLELGIGMGLNLALYDPAKVESVTGVDPAPELRAVAAAATLLVGTLLAAGCSVSPQESGPAPSDPHGTAVPGQPSSGPASTGIACSADFTRSVRIRHSSIRSVGSAGWTRQRNSS